MRGELTKKSERFGQDLLIDTKYLVTDKWKHSLKYFTNE